MPTKQSDTEKPNEHRQAKRPFTEPEISDPVDVVKGNLAAGALFAVAGSAVDAP